MTSPKPTPNPQAEAEFTRKMVLGILTTLEHKGLLTKEEVDSIILAARQAAYPPPPKPVSQVAPGKKVQTEWPKETKVNAFNPAQIAPAPKPTEGDTVPVIDMNMD